MRDRMIIALDTDAHTALGVARELSGAVDYVKVGMTLFYSEGPEIVDSDAGDGLQGLRRSQAA